MSTRVLVVNAGSSSVKLAVLDGDEVVKRESVDPGAAEEALGAVLAERVDAVGHRVVHGGNRFTGPTLVDDEVLGGIEELRAMAPLHQEPAVAALRQARIALPGVPQVACFDTAFHRTMPAAAYTYAVPARWRDGLGVRRYGFHGLAHEWAARRAAKLLGRPVGELRTVTAHLGSGASLCAVDRGRSVETGTRRRHAHPHLPGELRVPDGFERGHLLMAGLDEPRPVVGRPEGRDDPVDPVARIAEDLLDAPLSQPLQDVVAN